MNARFKSGLIRSLTSALVSSLPSLVLSILVLSSTRDAAAIFPALTALNAVKLPLLFLPGAVNAVFVDGVVAANKFNDQVNSLPPRPKVLPPTNRGNNDNDIILTNVTTSHFLTPLTLTIPSSKITSLLGPVGSGKSLLLSVISGITEMKGGTVEAPPVHRVSQSKWLPKFEGLEAIVSHP